MALNRDDLKNVRQRKYLGKDFDGLRAMLLEYVQQHYSDRVRDFSEASLGGMFLDLAAYVGDNLSFYLDHQFGELDPELAVENTNIERALNNAGVPIVGAAPALVPVTIYVQVPAEIVNNVTRPLQSAIPVVESGSIFSADNGTNFILIEDVDFRKKKSDGSYVANIKSTNPRSDGTPTAFIFAYSGLCISGEETTETVTIGSTFVPFREITLGNKNVSDIINVYDSLGNIYYHVESLTHDVVYKNVLNTAKDNDLVKDAIKIIPAPYRFKTKTNISNRTTTLVFGGGNASTLDDDIIPDPSDFAIPLPYSQTFSRISVNPNQLLQTKTLGVAATSTTLTVTYRHGGGLSHNVEPDSVKNVITLNMSFPDNPSASVAGAVRGSIEVSNKIRAAGGDDAPTIDELKELIPAIKNSQDRIVTRPDLLARIYTIPSNFGRVYRAGIRSNPNNPLATQVFIVSRDANSKLIVSPDTLKQNLVKYLNPYRMISDAIDILDARIVNYQIQFEILVDPNLNRNVVLQAVLTRLQPLVNIKNYHIDQPLIIDNIINSIYSVNGVITVNKIKFLNVSTVLNNREYSDITYDLEANTRKQIILPPPGGIFECRYPEVDIIGKVIV